MAERFILVTCTLVFSSGVGWGQQNTKASSEQNLLKNAKIANELIEKHLPELKVVLSSLSRKSPRDYQQAVAELARTSRRLDVYRQRDQQAYEVEVKLLQAQTRADLAMAELKYRDTDNARSKYKVAVAEREKARLSRMKYERQRTEERISKMRAQLETMTTEIDSFDLDAQVDRLYASAIRRLPAEMKSRSRNKSNGTSLQEKSKK